MVTAWISLEDYGARAIIVTTINAIAHPEMLHIANLRSDLEFPGWVRSIRSWISADLWSFVR